MLSRSSDGERHPRAVGTLDGHPHQLTHAGVGTEVGRPCTWGRFGEAVFEQELVGTLGARVRQMRATYATAFMSGDRPCTRGADASWTDTTTLYSLWGPSHAWGRYRGRPKKTSTGTWDRPCTRGADRGPVPVGL